VHQPSLHSIVQQLVATFTFKAYAQRDKIERRPRLVDILPTKINELAAHEKDLRLRYIRTSRDDLFEYLKTLQDSVRGRDGSHELTDYTSLVLLGKPKKFEPYGTVVSNLSGEAHTWQRCYFEVKDKLLPTPRSSFDFDSLGCNVFVPHRTLLYAACIRLELRLSSNKHDLRVMGFQLGLAPLSGLTIANQQLADCITKSGHCLLKLTDKMMEPGKGHQITLYCFEEVPKSKSHGQHGTFAKARKSKRKSDQDEDEDEKKGQGIDGQANPDLLAVQAYLPGGNRCLFQSSHLSTRSSATTRVLCRCITLR